MYLHKLWIIRYTLFKTRNLFLYKNFLIANFLNTNILDIFLQKILILPVSPMLKRAVSSQVRPPLSISMMYAVANNTRGRVREIATTQLNRPAAGWRLEREWSSARSGRKRNYLTVEWEQKTNCGCASSRRRLEERVRSVASLSVRVIFHMLKKRNTLFWLYFGEKIL